MLARRLCRDSHGPTYILLLVGLILFAKKSEDIVQLICRPLLSCLDLMRSLRWGSVVRHSHNCVDNYWASHKGVKELGRPMVLSHLWTWKHIHISRHMISRVRIEVCSFRSRSEFDQNRTKIPVRSLVCKKITIMGFRLSTVQTRNLPIWVHGLEFMFFNKKIKFIGLNKV